MQNSFIIQEYIDRYHSYVQIDTDASKTLINNVRIAFIVPEFHIKVGRGSTMKFQFTWEKCLHYYCSDTSSALNCLQHGHSDSRLDILIEIRLYRKRQ